MSLRQPPDTPPLRGDLRCSFCHKSGDQVASLVCGPTTDIAICDECVELCREIIAEQIAEQTTPRPDPPPAVA